MSPKVLTEDKYSFGIFSISGTGGKGRDGAPPCMQSGIDYINAGKDDQMVCNLFKKHFF